MINLLVFTSIIAIPIMVPIFSYAAMFGLTAESIIYERNRDINLLKMVQVMCESTIDQSSSASDHGVSLELAKKSESEAVKAEELQDQAKLLQKDSGEQEAMATKDEEMSDTLFEKASEEQEKAAEETAKIVKEESVYEADMEEANSEAAEAASNEAEGEGTGLATFLCNSIPFLDVLCDALGATAEVGIKTAETLDAAASIASYAAAATIKSQEEADLASAASLEAQADKDTISATKYQENAAREEEIAEEEKAEAESDEAKAKEDMDQSDKDEAGSTEKETESEAEETESGEAFERAMNYGLDATVDAALSILSSLPVFFFFSSRVVTQAVAPAASHVQRHLTANGFQGGVISIWSSIRIHTIRMFLHGLLFFWTVCVQNRVNNTWDAWHNSSIRQKGGIIIIFAVLAGSLNTMIFTYLDNQKYVKKIYSSGGINLNPDESLEEKVELFEIYKLLSFEFLSRICFHIPLILIEGIIFTVSTGGVSNGSKEVFTSISSWYAFAALSFPIIFMMILHTWLTFKDEGRIKMTVEIVETEHIISKTKDSKHAFRLGTCTPKKGNFARASSIEKLDEETGLLSHHKLVNGGNEIISKTLDRHAHKSGNIIDLVRLARKNMSALELPFSILLLTIVVTVLKSHASMTLTGLMPVIQYAINNLATVVGSVVGAYSIITLGCIICLCMTFFWTKVVHKHDSSGGELS